jgi:hypothetical protein
VCGVTGPSSWTIAWIGCIGGSGRCSTTIKVSVVMSDIRPKTHA